MLKVGPIFNSNFLKKFLQKLTLTELIFLAWPTRMQLTGDDDAGGVKAAKNAREMLPRFWLELKVQDGKWPKWT